MNSTERKRRKLKQDKGTRRPNVAITTDKVSLRLNLPNRTDGFDNITEAEINRSTIKNVSVRRKAARMPTRRGHHQRPKKARIWNDMLYMRRFQKAPGRRSSFRKISRTTHKSYGSLISKLNLTPRRTQQKKQNSQTLSRIILHVSNTKPRNPKRTEQKKQEKHTMWRRK